MNTTELVSPIRREIHGGDTFLDIVGGMISLAARYKTADGATGTPGEIDAAISTLTDVCEKRIAVCGDTFGMFVRAWAVFMDAMEDESCTLAQRRAMMRIAPSLESTVQAMHVHWIDEARAIYEDWDASIDEIIDSMKIEAFNDMDEGFLAGEMYCFRRDFARLRKEASIPFPDE